MPLRRPWGSSRYSVVRPPPASELTRTFGLEMDISNQSNTTVLH